MAENDVFIAQKNSWGYYQENILASKPGKTLVFDPKGKVSSAIRIPQRVTYKYGTPVIGTPDLNNISSNGQTCSVNFMHNMSQNPITGRIFHWWSATPSHAASWGQIIGRYSDDGGTTWSAYITICDYHTTIDSANSSGGYSKSGRLFVFYCKRDNVTAGLGARHRYRGLWFKFSDDDGITWTDEAEMTTTEIHSTYLTHNGRRITSLNSDGNNFWIYAMFGPLVDDGIYLYQTYYCYGNANTTDDIYSASKIVIARSSDGGLTWDDNWNEVIYKLGLYNYTGNAYRCMPSEPIMFYAGGGEYFMITRDDSLTSDGKASPLILRTNGGIGTTAGNGNWGRQIVTGISFLASTDTFSKTAHGLVQDQLVRITGTLPTGLTANVLYYVVYVDANSFRISNESGGAAIDCSTDGSSLTATVVADHLDMGTGEGYSTTAQLYWNHTINGAVVDINNFKVFALLYTNRKDGKLRYMLAKVDDLIELGKSAMIQATKTDLWTYGSVSKSHGNGAILALDGGLSFLGVEVNEYSSSNTPAFFFKWKESFILKWWSYLIDFLPYNDLSLASGKVVKIAGNQIIAARQTAVSASTQEATADSANESNSDASDLATAITLLNSLKAKYNLQVTMANSQKAKYNALQTSYAGLITKLQAHGLIT